MIRDWQEIVIDDQLSPIGFLRPSVSPLLHSYTSDPLTHSHAVRSDNSMNYDRLYALSGAIYQRTGLVSFPDCVLGNMVCSRRT